MTFILFLPECGNESEHPVCKRALIVFKHMRLCRTRPAHITNYAGTKRYVILREMATLKRYTLLRFFVRSLVPSGMSLYICSLLSAFWIALHLILLSAVVGYTSLPGLLRGQWATFYTNTVARPIEVLTNNPSFGNVIAIVLWGLFGLVVYSAIEFAVLLVREERQAEEDMQWGQRILHHPMRRAYIVTMVWRASVLLVAFAVVVTLSPLPQLLLEADARLVAGSYDLAGGLQQLGLALVCWTMIMHGFVVFLRLLLLKPRLFGDVRLMAN
jgi:hypothetical protein